MKKVKIKEIDTKTVETKYGEKQKIDIKVPGKEGDYTLSGFANSVNRTWKVGDTVEVEIETREVNGKTYYNYKVPGVGKGDNSKIIQDILGRIKAIEARLEKLEQMDASECSEETEEDEDLDLPF